MNYSVLLAGGIGARFQNDNTPKQYVCLNGIPLLLYSLKTAQLNDNIDEVCVVAAKKYWDQIWNWVEENDFSKVKKIAESGKERHESVYSGLKAIQADKSDTVMIMTSVCPLLSQNTINEHYRLIGQYAGVITVIPATDAITYSSDGKYAGRTLQKKRLFVQQGPQTYHYNILLNAHEEYNARKEKSPVYEDSELVLDQGYDIGMVNGDRYCVKVTYPEDLAIAEALLPLFEKKEKERNA